MRVGALHQLDGGVGREGRAPREEFVEDRAKRVDVGTLVGRFAAGLLGRNIGGRAVGRG